MPTQLTPVEARILGCLVEKSKTTPDLYPLSLNALTNACNQKSSRDPVMNLEEAAVARELAGLQQKQLVTFRSEAGSRVPKFLHQVGNLLAGTDQQIGVLCVLLLRGAQTPGEIKTRTDRLCTFETTAEVETILNDLAAHPEGAYVVRLARQPGQKEARFMHTICGEPTVGVEPISDVPSIAALSTMKPDRVQQLEEKVAGLEERLAQLEVRLNVNAAPTE